jgi:hypothetical protein
MQKKLKKQTWKADPTGLDCRRSPADEGPPDMAGAKDPIARSLFSLKSFKRKK